MKVERKSPLTGNVSTMDLPITQEQLDRWKSGELIQNVFPRLTADEREFLLTGYTAEDWATLFNGDDE
jgi:hypothetical protein